MNIKRTMEKDKTIKKELEELNSPLQFIKPSDEPFEVPPGYFENLSSEIKERIFIEPERKAEVTIFPSWVPKVSVLVLLIGFLIAIAGYLNQDTSTDAFENYIVENVDSEVLIDFMLQEQYPGYNGTITNYELEDYILDYFDEHLLMEEL